MQQPKPVPEENSKEVDESRSIIAKWDFKEPLHFFIPDPKSFINQITAEKKLKLTYNEEDRILYAHDSHTARYLLRLKLRLIQWDYSTGFKPLLRTKTSPDEKELANISTKYKLKLTDIRGVVLSGNEKTTVFLKDNLGFTEPKSLENLF